MSPYLRLMISGIVACSLAACGGSDDENPVVIGDQADEQTPDQQQLEQQVAGFGDEIPEVTTPIIANNSPTQDQPIAYMLAGSFSGTPLAAERGYDIAGRSLLIQHNAEAVVVQTYVTGLPANQTFSTHLHNQPCALGGGSHYFKDSTFEEVVRENELWPNVTTDANGVGFGQDSADHQVRQDAVSIVVHDQDRERIACSDLEVQRDQTIYRGDFAPLDPNNPSPLTGVVEMAVTDEGTYAHLVVENATPTAEYSTHIHALPCEIDAAGGHYLIDTSITEVIPENELWLPFVGASDGTGSSSLVSKHRARRDAASVVIHNDQRDKLVCADLEIKQGQSLVHEGGLVNTAAGLLRGYSLSGSGYLSRNLDGSTEVAITVHGLTPENTYRAHLHDRSCAVGGGGHYKIDPSISIAIENNEMWFDLDVDTNGYAQASATLAGHIVRPEGQSVVIHDLNDGARIGCISL